MNNPYIDRVVARMGADGARQRIPKYWAFRCERVLHRLGYWLECCGLPSWADRYTSAIDPVVAWLGRVQSRYIFRRYF
jgi:hypothetical protein